MIGRVERTTDIRLISAHPMTTTLVALLFDFGPVNGPSAVLGNRVTDPVFGGARPVGFGVAIMGRFS